VAHAAQDDEVEDGLLVAFVRHTDALIADLGWDRAEFWKPQLDVVEALLVEASDKVERKVKVSIAAARVNFDRRWGSMDPEVVEVATRLASSWDPKRDTMQQECPACGATGISDGSNDVTWEADGSATVWFYAANFYCRLCNLELWGIDELEHAGLEWDCIREGADPADYTPGADEQAEADALGGMSHGK